MAIEIYITSSKPEPKVMVKRLENGQSLLITNLLKDTVEVVAIQCNEQGTGGKAYARDMGSVDRQSFKNEEVIQDEHLAGLIDRGHNYWQELGDAHTTAQMLVAHIDKPIAKAAKP